MRGGAGMDREASPAWESSRLGKKQCRAFLRDRVGEKKEERKRQVRTPTSLQNGGSHSFGSHRGGGRGKRKREGSGTLKLLEGVQNL